MDVNRIKSGVRRVLGGLALPMPRSIKEGQHSAIYYEDHGEPSSRLLQLGLDAAAHARHVDLSAISGRIRSGPAWPDRWPGEHYRLLVGLVHALQPRTVIEIGTYQGISALALERELPQGGVVHTYDVLPLDTIPGQILRQEDLETGRIVAHVADLTVPEVYEQHRATIQAADLIFVDAAKDGRMEQTFLEAFEQTRFENVPIVVFDDIRLWNMLDIWRGVRRAKLDLTSFGHWSGTGLIDWSEAGSEGRA